MVWDERSHTVFQTWQPRRLGLESHGEHALGQPQRDELDMGSPLMASFAQKWSRQEYETIDPKEKEDKDNSEKMAKDGDSSATTSRRDGLNMRVKLLGNDIINSARDDSQGHHRLALAKETSIEDLGNRSKRSKLGRCPHAGTPRIKAKMSHRQKLDGRRPLHSYRLE